jgi:hypothetical protein
LIFFVSLAYSYETIEFFLKAIDKDAVAWIDDNPCEEKSETEKNETEESGKKSELLKYNQPWNVHEEMLDASKKLITIGSNQNNNFSSSDYSLKIYSPPETI